MYVYKSSEKRAKATRSKLEENKTPNDSTSEKGSHLLLEHTTSTSNGKEIYQTERRSKRRSRTTNGVYLDFFDSALTLRRLVGAESCPSGATTSPTRTFLGLDSPDRARRARSAASCEKKGRRGEGRVVEGQSEVVEEDERKKIERTPDASMEMFSAASILARSEALEASILFR